MSKHVPSVIKQMSKHVPSVIKWANTYEA
jgi:hypothetical protein